MTLATPPVGDDAGRTSGQGTDGPLREGTTDPDNTMGDYPTSMEGEDGLDGDTQQVEDDMTQEHDVTQREEDENAMEEEVNEGENTTLADDKAPMTSLEPEVEGAAHDEEAREGDEIEGEGDGEEEEEEEPEMSPEEKREMYQSVVDGDIDLLDDLLDLPGADINMIWFQENLLMAAIRANQLSMAEFLVDNGIDYTYKTAMLVASKEEKGKLQSFPISCRQMAYDHAMFAIVDLIDELTGNLWPFIKPRERQIRLKMPLEEKRILRGELDTDEEEEILSLNEDGVANVPEETPGPAQDPHRRSSETRDVVIPDDVIENELEFGCEHLEDDMPSGNSRSSSDGASRTSRSRPTHTFRETRTSYARRRSAQDHIQSMRGPRSLPLSTQTRNYPSESLRHSAGQVRRRPRTPDRKSSSPTRILSPWNDDDPNTLDVFQRRSRSAAVSFGSRDMNSRQSSLPVIQRAHPGQRAWAVRINPTYATYQKHDRMFYEPTGSRAKKHTLATSWDSAGPYIRCPGPCAYSRSTGSATFMNSKIPHELQSNRRTSSATHSGDHSLRHRSIATQTISDRSVIKFARSVTVI